MTTAKTAGPLKELELAALGAAAIPGLNVLGTKDFASWGDESCVTLVDSDGGDWQVVSLPRQVDTDRAFRVQDYLGGLIQNRQLSFRVPAVKAVVPRPDATVIVYPHIGGHPGTSTLVDSRLFARSFAKAIAALHELPFDRFSNAAEQVHMAAERREEYRALIERNRSIPSSLRARWKGAVDDDTLWFYQEVPVHGSMEAHQLQVAHGEAVIGIRGFDSARIDDPVYDLLWLLYEADDEFLAAFETAYSEARSHADLHLLTRAQLVAELQTLAWYDQIAQSGDQQQINQGIATLRQMAEDLDGQLLVAPQQEVLEISFAADEEPLLRVNPHLRGLPETSPTVVADSVEWPQS